MMIIFIISVAATRHLSTIAVCLGKWTCCSTAVVQPVGLQPAEPADSVCWQQAVWAGGPHCGDRLCFTYMRTISCITCSLGSASL
jgi:hypothetical protein